MFTVLPMKSGINQRAGQASRLVTARRAAGFKTPADAIARFGWKGSTYMAHENGQNGLRLEPALAYAKAFGVEAGWLLTGDGRGPSIPDDLSVKGIVPPPEPSQNPMLSGDKLKVLGMAECGPEGWAWFNGEIVDWVARPANLAGAKDAYAVFIVGDSMTDRYHPGEVAFIHPGKPVTPGAYVLVQRRPKTAGEPPLAVIKRLVKRSGDKVILEQLNPPKTVTLTTADIVSMHRVVGSVEA